MEAPVGGPVNTPAEPLANQRRCPACLRIYDLPFGPRDGRPIQVQFPTATPEQREMYLSGLCSTKCWNDFLGPDDDGADPLEGGEDTEE